MKLSYKQRLFLYFAIIFTIFTVVVVIFEQSREKQFKTEALEEKLDAYTEITHAALLANEKGEPTSILDSLLALLPQNIRLSLINKEGYVIYDNSVKNLSGMQNHAERPEITAALESNTGTDIRISTSTNQEYLYYAKKFGGNYIRVALPYDIQTQRFLQTDNLFLYFILIFFIIMLLIVNVITNRFGKSINQLRDFLMLSDNDYIGHIDFPKDELGEIGMKITDNYHQLKESRKTINMEREKLLQHIHSSEEGICFFNVDRDIQFYNGLFIQYLNILADDPNSDPSTIFTDPTFDDINQYLAKPNGNYFETQIRKQGKTFSLRINIFEDQGFDIVLNDITKQEKTRQLKHEMTGNIAHELRTPVTGIRGYLETVIEQPLNEKQKQHFITQAYNQTIVLSELIRDMTLLTKIEEAPQSFVLEKVDINEFLTSLKDDFDGQFKNNNITMSWDVPEGASINGNKNLLYSLFRNLIDNTIRYAGKGIDIKIILHKEDRDSYYFSYYDTGTGITEERHLNRLFERFYRINEGRTRDTGGSGLGLSIVRNAVAFHKGTITAKNRKEGGLEFLFNLNKGNAKSDSADVNK